MNHRANASCIVAMLVLLPLSACAEGDTAVGAAAVEPGQQELIAAMQANFITDLSRSFGPAVGETNANGEPNFEVVSFEQASMDPAGDGCWRYSGEVTTVMRGVIPVPSHDSSSGEFTVCRQAEGLVVTEKAMRR